MPEARSFSSILNSSGKVKRATKSCRKDRKSNSKKRRPAGTFEKHHLCVYAMNRAHAMSAGKVDRTPDRDQRSSTSGSEMEPSEAQTTLEA